MWQRPLPAATREGHPVFCKCPLRCQQDPSNHGNITFIQTLFTLLQALSQPSSHQACKSLFGAVANLLPELWLGLPVTQDVTHSADPLNAPVMFRQWVTNRTGKHDGCAVHLQEGLQT